MGLVGLGLPGQKALLMWVNERSVVLQLRYNLPHLELPLGLEGSGLLCPALPGLSPCPWLPRWM